MSNVAKLKKKAAELEQKKQFDKALALYIEAIEEQGEGEDEADVALFNRVGDLMLRQGNVGDAVTYYEKAVDLYAEGGFFNNAIALCNKILRQSPGRNSIYYKLGKISAKKGFKSDAKANFLEYADRMQKAGQIDEAFRALKEFADLCPDQDDIRLMLADQLAKKDRKSEALEQLQQLYERYEGEGQKTEARATIERMKAIDPKVEVKSGGRQHKEKTSDLVFLDVSWEEPKGKPAPRKTTQTRPPLPAEDDLPPGLEALTPRLSKTEMPPPVDRAEPAGTGTGAGSLDGFMQTHEPTAEEVTIPDGDNLLGFETTSLSGATESPGEGIVISDPEPSSPREFDAMRLETPMSVPVIEPPEHDLALPGELPSLSLPSDDGAGGGLTLIMPDDEPAMLAASDSGSLLDLSPPISRTSVPVKAPPPLKPKGPSAPAAPAPPPSRGKSSDDLPLLEVDFGTPPKGSHEIEPIGLDLSMTSERAAPAADAPVRRSRSSTSVLAQSVDGLRIRLADDPENWPLRRQLGEALLEANDREGGLKELEAVMVGFEKAKDLDSARSIAEEIIRLDPNSVRHLQKRVEYAFRMQDKASLTDAYVELADALLRAGQADKSRSVYERVLELAPDDPRALAALATYAPPAPPPPPAKKEKEKPRPTTAAKRYTAELKRGEVEKAPVPTSADADFVNLGDWLREDVGTPKSTRMVVEEQAPTGDEQADFADMLKKFKAGVAENVEEEDYDSHYDLGVAYKEMGLLDEAISEFQKALRGAERRVRAYEALGQCFLEKKQFQVAHTILTRALSEKGIPDDQLVGVLYLLGYTSEAIQDWKGAMNYYQRVFAVDIQFRDVSDRLTALEKVAR